MCLAYLLSNRDIGYDWTRMTGRVRILVFLTRYMRSGHSLMQEGPDGRVS